MQMSQPSSQLTFVQFANLPPGCETRLEYGRSGNRMPTTLPADKIRWWRLDLNTLIRAHLAAHACKHLDPVAEEVDSAGDAADPKEHNDQPGTVTHS